MLQKFSKGYYLKTYWVRLTDESQNAEINDAEYESLKESLYENTPIVMKMHDNHFTVTGDENVSSQTLEIGRDFISDERYRRNPFKKDVFVVKPSVVQNLYTM